MLEHIHTNRSQDFYFVADQAYCKMNQAYCWKKYSTGFFVMSLGLRYNRVCAFDVISICMAISAILEASATINS